MTTSHTFNASADQCRVTFLTGREGILDFLKLHNAVYFGLPFSRRHFLKKRNFRDLANHLNGGHHIIAVYTPDNVMVAQGLVTYPDREGSSNLKGYPFDAMMPAENCVIVQSLGVHPQANGKRGGYVNLVLDGARAIAEGAGRGFVVAKMASGNGPSMAAFRNAGYEEYGDHVIVKGESYVSAFMRRAVEADGPFAPLPGQKLPNPAYRM